MKEKIIGTYKVKEKGINLDFKIIKIDNGYKITRYLADNKLSEFVEGQHDTFENATEGVFEIVKIIKENHFDLIKEAHPKLEFDEKCMQNATYELFQKPNDDPIKFTKDDVFVFYVDTDFEVVLGYINDIGESPEDFIFARSLDGFWLAIWKE